MHTPLRTVSYRVRLLNEFMAIETPVARGDSEAYEEGQTKGNEVPGCDQHGSTARVTSRRDIVEYGFSVIGKQ